MLNKDFYPTPENVINDMLFGLDLFGKEVLEPSAGSGNIVDALNDNGALVSACEIEPKLRDILKDKCDLIGTDFLKLQKEDCSHFDFIIMNPPFSADEDHILHAWEIAPNGCEIIALCNYNTLSNNYSRKRKELITIINNYGQSRNLGNVFSDAERETNVDIGLIRLNKPKSLDDDDFSDFFELEDSDINGTEEGIVQFNEVRNIVQRVTGAIKLFDLQVEQATKMNDLCSEFGSMKDLTFVVKSEDKQYNRETFRREIQKKGWDLIFRKMNMQKYMTSGVKEDVNKFIIQQKNVPFTMRNIYQMMNLIVQTYPNQIDKSIEEVFDKMTSHHYDNRFSLEGWKTNSHYILNEKFIFPYIVSFDYGMSVRSDNRNVNIVEDLVRVLCFLTGKNYDNCISLSSRITQYYHLEVNGELLRRKEWKSILETFKTESDVLKFVESKGITNYKILEPLTTNTWYDWEFFEIKFFKKGTMHFKFKDRDVWAKFNQNVARIKGLVLPDKF